MAQTISPFFRSPFTDLTGGMVSHHLLGRCQRQEIRLMDCLEAHGLDRGMRECGPLIDDYRECHTLKKQFQRFMAMRAERERQIAAGILTGDKKYVSPRVDSY